MAMREFDLNIERVLENWTVAHALREVIANALDEQALTGTREPEIFQDGEGRWHIRDWGRGLRYEHRPKPCSCTMPVTRNWTPRSSARCCGPEIRELQHGYTSMGCVSQKRTISCSLTTSRHPPALSAARSTASEAMSGAAPTPIA